MNTISSLPLLLLLSLITAGCSGTNRPYIYQVNNHSGGYKCGVTQEGVGDFTEKNCEIKDQLVILYGHTYTIPDETKVISIKIHVDAASSSGEAELKFCLAPTKGKDFKEHEHVIHKLAITKPQ